MPHALRRALLVLARLVPGMLALLLPAVLYSQAPSEAAPASLSARLGEGATVRSADGRFSLKLRARIQARATLLSEPGDEPPAVGMMIRRMRVVFSGDAMGPELTYYIQLAFSNRDMEPDLRSPLRDAYVTWAIARDLQLRFGQMKVPHDRQRLVSSSTLQMVDRSIVVAELNLDRDVGLHFFSRDLFGWDGKLAYSLGVFGGDGRNRVADAHGLLYAARVELRPWGSFEDYSEVDFVREPKPKLAIGVSGAYNQNTNRPRSTFGKPFEDARFNYAHANADLIFKWLGFSLLGEWIVRVADRDTRVGEQDGIPTTFRSRSGWGAFGQVGQLLPFGLELSARYGYLRGLGDARSEIPAQHELGLALSHYWQKHDLKLQGDYFRLSETRFTNASHQVRVQAQLYF